MRRKNLLKRIGFAFAIFVSLAVILISIQPPDFRITRSVTVAAPAQSIFAHVNDLHKWDAWSPWSRLDPTAKARFEGPRTGKESTFHWSGNKEIGEGTMTITESEPHRLVRIKIEFVRPFTAVNMAEFTFASEGEHTIVTWSMYGPNNFMAKAMHLLMDMEKMLGSDFERGLERLKAIAETSSRNKSSEQK